MPLPESNHAAGRKLQRDVAYEALFDAIQTGQLTPGEALRDDELQSWLGMSRTPIRYALFRLAEVGLVNVSAGRPSTVAQLAPDRTNRALFVSAIFNEYTVRRVVGRETEPMAVALAFQRDEVRAAADSSDGPRVARSVAAFFAVLNGRVQNRQLDEQVRLIDAELSRFLAPGSTVLEIDLQQIRRSIETLYDAAIAKNVPAALEALRILHAPTLRNFLERFREPEVD